MNVLKYLYAYFAQGSNQNTTVSEYVVPPYESYKTRRIGARFDARALSLEYSQDRRDSTISSYQAWNFRGSAGIRPLRNMDLSGYLTWNQTEYEPQVFTSKHHARGLETRMDIPPEIWRRTWVAR